MGEITIKIPQSVTQDYQIDSEVFLPEFEHLVKKFVRVQNEPDLGLANGDEEQIRAERMNWLKKNREKYAGQYVALDGNRLVGTGKTIREANEQAKENDVQNPFLIRVSGENEILFGGL
jgi:hypothetical protein